MAEMHVMGVAEIGFDAVVFVLGALLSMSFTARGSFPSSDGSAKTVERDRKLMIFRRSTVYIIMAHYASLIRKLNKLEFFLW